MSICERIFYILNEREIMAKDLADAIGVSKSVVSSWKTRGSNPPAELLVKICGFLNISLEYLLTGETDTKSPNKLTPGEQAIYEQVHPLSEAEKYKIAGAIPLLRLLQDTPMNALEDVSEQMAVGLFAGSTSRD